MNRENIIAQIGREILYEEACYLARLAAEDPNYGSVHSTPFNSDIPHTISDLVWDSLLPTEERLRLIFQFYEEMPCYAYLMYLKQNFRRFTQAERNTFWGWVRDQLESNDVAMSAPMIYALWCDFFEDPRTVTESWNSLVNPLPNDSALQLLLIHAGPVPFALKQPLYDTLIHNQIWHFYIFRSLLNSQFDVYGDLDRNAAIAILKRLVLPSQTEHVDTLRKSLGF